MWKYFLDTNKLADRKYPKLLLIGFCLVVTAIVLGVVIQYGVRENPELVGFGFITFAIASVLAIVIMLISWVMMELHLKKHHFSVWRESKSTSPSVKAEALRQIKLLGDPYLKKLSLNSTKIGVFCFLIWLVLFLAVTCIVFITGESNFVKMLFEK